ncbi:hypothetical protein N7481_001577 [Penicillium waksmanii]|uniref:uncharacterized protein n=1 Tax=Penicillium waksmanii TaxID=69791 RepID=UPI002547D3DC|nr:uncharacterized protein N7481_001577 [Penicillium waksmanii]KAJ6001168.1 hypothetical protein N7481_001577 [Penicillium waksmanii]
MDAPTFCCDPEGDENTESNAIPSQTERCDPEMTTEKAPPADLEQDDPKLAFQAARILGLYRRLWESCMSKRVGSERLEQTNQELRKENKRLENEKGLLLAHHDEQLSQFDHLNQALDSSRERLVSILNDWEQCSQSEVRGLMNCEREH